MHSSQEILHLEKMADESKEHGNRQEELEAIESVRTVVIEVAYDSGSLLCRNAGPGGCPDFNAKLYTCAG